MTAEGGLGISAHTKSKVHGPPKAHYPETASDPFNKDIWRRGKAGKRKSHFEGEAIKKIVEKLIKSKTKKEQSEDARTMPRIKETEQKNEIEEECIFPSEETREIKPRKSKISTSKRKRTSDSNQALRKQKRKKVK